MPRKSAKKPKLTNTERHKRFLKAASDAQASEDAKDFARAFKNVITSKKRG